MGEAPRVRARIAPLSFGGPAGQTTMMHRIPIEGKRWPGDGRFLPALNVCMQLSGPEAQPLSTRIGWLRRGTRGGVIAGALFVLPGVLASMASIWTAALFGDVGFGPLTLQWLVPGLFDWAAAALAALALLTVLRLKLGMATVLGSAALLG
ncbi:MAG: chromate transporter, partial [Mangrovicoccus sp.]|nr:chromate transporter [Mangrovicoccus sp.]